MSANLAPAEKLPLAVRKNLRDGWDNKKGDLGAQLTDLLGTPWTFDINPLAIYPYAEEGSYGQRSLGDCIFGYADGFVWQLKRFLDSHSTALKDEINSVVITHSITLVASTKFSYCGVDVESGVLRLLFHPTNLGSNINDAAADLPNVLSSAPQPSNAPALSFKARHSIAKDFEPKIGELLLKAQTALQNPALEFEPSFDELSKMLKQSKEVRDDWEINLGSFARGYYESFVDVLEREKFGEDDLLRDGFAEAVEKGVVRLRVVEKLVKGSCNEILLEEGMVVMQTTPANWGTNIDSAAAKLVDVL